MIEQTSYAAAVAGELDLTSSAYAGGVAGGVSLTSSAYGVDVANAINGGTPIVTRDLCVCQYNIGHFNMGTSSGASCNIKESYTDGYPTSTRRNYTTQLQRWTSRISGIGADIIGAPEWNNNFGYDGNNELVSTVESGIFNDYIPSDYTTVEQIAKRISAGKNVASSWWINTLVSKYDMTGADDTNLGSTGGEAAYVHHATITVKGEQVKIGVTHLNWARTSAHVASREVEIRNLIKMMNQWLETYDHVIIFGDFNTDGSVIQSASKTEADFMAGANEFDPFIYGFDDVVNGVTTHINGGFTLANHGQWGDLKTADATGSRPDHLTDPERGNNNPNTFYNRPFCVLDNIIVKGFTMSNVQVIDDGTLTDHCAVVADLTLIDNE